MTNELTIAGVEITTDEEGRFNLNCLHHASSESNNPSKKPSEWLRLSSTQALINEHNDQSGDSRFGVFTARGGNSPGTFAHELLAISYAGWISPAFQLQVNRTFIDYKTGKLNPAPTELSRMDLITMAMEAEKERLQLAAKVEEDAPKVHFHDVVTRSEGLLTTAEAAKSIGTGRNRLMAFMRQSGWLRRNNEPYQDKIERGWLDVRISEFEKPTGDIAKQITPMVTSLGLTRLTDLYQQRIGEVA